MDNSHDSNKPVAWAWLKDGTPVNVFLTRGDADDPYWQDKGYSTAPLYTSPPASKPWVGLTDEERDSFWKADQMTSKEWDELFNAIEAKLREKNA